MAFTFTAQPSEAPIPETELARISWQDTSWATQYAAYIHDFTTDASIDAREWVRRIQDKRLRRVSGILQFGTIQV
jgi:hypothetical protein